MAVRTQRRTYTRLTLAGVAIEDWPEPLAGSRVTFVDRGLDALALPPRVATLGRVAKAKAGGQRSGTGCHEIPGTGQPLVAPIITPRMKYRCSHGYTSTIGSWQP